MFSGNLILIAAAVIPAVVLMIKVYNADKMDKESPSMMLSLLVFGVLSTTLAGFTERLGRSVLLSFTEQDSMLYNVLFYFVIVALSEEGFKYLVLKKKTWKSPEFNCQFDGVVYAVFVSLGFALWENIAYVLQYGFQTAIVRAITAVPGHASFGVFMGIWYGLAKRYDYRGQSGKAAVMKKCAVIVPTLVHGTYDFLIASGASDFIFVGFIVVVFAAAFRSVKKFSKEDEVIGYQGMTEEERNNTYNGDIRKTPPHDDDIPFHIQ